MAGRRWIFLRGLVRERAHWGDFLARFSEAFPDDEVNAVDLPGCGARSAERAPLTVAATVAAVRTVRSVEARAATEGAVHLFAISLGCLVALEWLRRHPAEVAGAVLVNGSLAGESPPWHRLRPKALVALAGAALTSELEARERRVLAVVSARPARAAAVLPEWVEAARARPVRATTALRQLVAAARYRFSPPPAPPPSLVLAGGADRLVDPRCSRRIALRLGASLREHPTAGHDLPLDEPGWVLDEVRAWAAPRECYKWGAAPFHL